MRRSLKESLINQKPGPSRTSRKSFNRPCGCKNIVSELLEFSRQSVGKVSTIDLQGLVRKSLNLLIEQALFQDIDVRVDIEPDLPRMAGDLGQLQQVFTNLFINAADAMEGKGSLEVRARYLPEKERFQITVSDTGPGIPEALRDKVFEIFFTTKPVGRGTGLGLSISKKIIELHGGDIAFHSPPEGGTTPLPWSCPWAIWRRPKNRTCSWIRRRPPFIDG